MNERKIWGVLKKYRRFLIATHVNPDPDALCSQLALAAYLRANGRQVLLINEEPVPERFHFLPGAARIRALRKKMRAAFDAVVILDCGDLARIGAVRGLIKKTHVIINIDHHITNHRYGDVNWVSQSASSTAEMVYRLLHHGRFALTRDTATLLYIGIMTDTGSFRYENTTADSHWIVSRLIPYGIPVSELYSRLYESIPLTDLEYFTRIVNTFESLFKGRVICLELKKKMLKKFSREFDVRDKIFRYLRAIKGVEVIVIFTEIKRGHTRVNLRSQRDFNVARVAFHFNGGGHRRASGCHVSRPLPEARKLVLKEIKKAL